MPLQNLAIDCYLSTQHQCCHRGVGGRGGIDLYPYCGMFGYIQELQGDPIPAPSQMAWKDVCRILDNEIPAPNDLSNIEETPAIEAVQTVAAKINGLFRNVNEMEATIRVSM